MKTQEEYLDEYISLMEVARNRPTPEGYTEKHHIFPKSWMPNDYIVVLTAQEHFIAHYLLSKAFPEDKSMTYAFWLMCNKVGSDKQDRYYEVEAEIYAEAKKAYAKVKSEEMTGKKFSTKTRAKMSAAHAGEKNHMFGKKRSSKLRAKLSATHAGKKLSAETRAKMSAAHAGKTPSLETRAKLSVSNSGNNNSMRSLKWKRTCPHCNKTVAKSAFSTWHGDKCKLK